MLIESKSLWVASTNCWVVATGPGQECVIIDIPPDPDAVLALVRQHELRVAAVISTHGHVDHVGGMGAAVREANPQAPVHIHDDDKHMLLDPIAASPGFGAYLESSGLDLRPPEVIEGLDHGQVVSGAGLKFKTIHTPGHTQGSVCLLMEVEGEAPVLFSGDHLFKGSIGRTDLPGGSFDQLMQSMEERILPLDDAIRVLPGHGPSTTIGDERRTNPFLVQFSGVTPHRHG